MALFFEWFLAGGLVGGGWLLFFRRVSAKRGAGAARYELRMWAITLIVAALLYVGFAAVGGASASWLATELCGVVLYSSLALLGLRGRPRLIALGWLGHMLWDGVLHYGGHPEYVPSWYVRGCMGFDLAAGLTLWLRARTFQPTRAVAHE